MEGRKGTKKRKKEKERKEKEEAKERNWGEVTREGVWWSGVWGGEKETKNYYRSL